MALKAADLRASTLPRRGLHRTEAAVYVGLSPSKFDELVADGRMPKAKRIDSRNVWDLRALDMYFDALPDENVANTWEDVA
nr:hypothetical protein [Rhodoligotrophos appendicifer]